MHGVVRASLEASVVSTSFRAHITLQIVVPRIEESKLQGHLLIELEPMVQDGVSTYYNN